MKSKYTIADCPMCGQPFNKHINAIYCSPRCANKAARDRRMARGPGPDWMHSQSTTDETFKPNYLGPTPIQHTILEKLAERIHAAYTGTTKNGKILHGGGELRIVDLSPEALGSFTPPLPVVLREKPRVMDDEPRIISMGLPLAFGEEPPPPPPTPRGPSAIDLLKEFK